MKALTTWDNESDPNNETDPANENGPAGVFSIHVSDSFVNLFPENLILFFYSG